MWKRIRYLEIPRRHIKYCSKECGREGKSKYWSEEYDRELRSRPWGDLSYGLKHNWIRKNYGARSLCDRCGKTDDKKFEWANLSGLYLQDRSDWERLCCKCHRNFDFSKTTPRSEYHTLRTIETTPRGEKHPNHILTEIQVLDIRRFMVQGVKKSDLAHKFGVSKSTIYAIHTRKIWKWLK
mgnify:CR=1 FL=1